MRIPMRMLLVVPLLVVLAGCDGNPAPPRTPPAIKGSSGTAPIAAEPKETLPKESSPPKEATESKASPEKAAEPTASEPSTPDPLEELAKAVEAAESPDQPADSDQNAATTLDLASIVGYRAVDFDAATDFPWPAMPRGKHTFVNVPVDISGAIFLWGARNDATGMVYPKSQPKIPVRKKAEAIYVCHTAFYEAEPGAAVFEIVCHYPEKEATLGPIVCGGDTHDWFARGDDAATVTNDRSALAWSGVGKAGERDQRVQMFITELDNPHPDDEIVTLDLVSSQKDTAGCILAVTVGPKGLLKKSSAKEVAEPQK